MTAHQTVPSSHALAMQAASDRFTALLRQAPSADTPIPHLDWTVGELGAHVLSGIRLYTSALVGDQEMWATVTDGPRYNAALLAETPERQPAELAAAIDVAARTFIQAVDESGRTEFAWHAGIRVPLWALMRMIATDILVHGWDLARACHRPWLISREDAQAGVEAVVVIAPHFVAPAAARVKATYDVRLRGGGGYTFAFDNGVLRTSMESPAVADCTLSCDPEAFLLTAYGRIPLWRSVIAGNLLCWGRKPWLGLRFTSLLLNP